MFNLVLYALNLDAETHRILSVTYDQFAPKTQPRVESFPENPYDYLYVDGKFVYDPIPVDETPVDPEDAIPLEQKVADLEAAVFELAEMLGGEG